MKEKKSEGTGSAGGVVPHGGAYFAINLPVVSGGSFFGLCTGNSGRGIELKLL